MTKTKTRLIHYPMPDDPRYTVCGQRLDAVTKTTTAAAVTCLACLGEVTDPTNATMPTPPPFPNAHTDAAAVLARIAREQYGFLSPTDVAAIAADVGHNGTLLLVRCGAGRFLAPAYYVQQMIDTITKDGRDYVRDVSLPARS